jgi:hypothetical protein
MNLAFKPNQPLGDDRCTKHESRVLAYGEEVAMAHEKPPDLNDMFLAGLWLADALLLEKAIGDEPDVPADVWWDRLARITPFSGGSPTSQ